MNLKDRSLKHSVRVGEPGNEKIVDACDIEGCWKPATQFHGTFEHPIHTCDEHAEEVMLELMRTVLGINEGGETNGGRSGGKST